LRQASALTVGGHSDGLQFVRVHTRRGWVVLASDAIHFYANVETGNPFPIVFNVGDMMEGWARCRRLADSKDHVVPGHDPLVRARYPAPSPELEGDRGPARRRACGPLRRTVATRSRMFGRKVHGSAVVAMSTTPGLANR
jgi:glyoxylase-like metal-dependent hydrolase (beta-lactamase superfamily II)